MLLAITDLTWSNIAPLLANGVIRGAAYGVLGVGFAIILGVTGRFHFAFSFTYALAAYGVFWAYDRAGMPFALAAIFGVAVCVISGLLIERTVYRTLARASGAGALLTIFVASLGLGIAGENAIRLTFSSANQQVLGPTGFRTPIHLGPATFRWLDVWQVLTGVVLVLALTALLRFTALGRSIKATRGNPEMAQIIGINPNTIYLICFGIGSLFAGVAAYWYGIKFSAAPDMGGQTVIYAFVVAFLAGTASPPIRIFLTGIAISLVESLSTLFLESRWTQLVVFIILTGYLATLSVDPQKLLVRMRRPAALPARPAKPAKV